MIIMDNYMNKNKAKIYSEKCYVTLAQVHFNSIMSAREREKQRKASFENVSINLTLYFNKNIIESLFKENYEYK